PFPIRRRIGARNGKAPYLSVPAQPYLQTATFFFLQDERLGPDHMAKTDHGMTKPLGCGGPGKLEIGDGRHYATMIDQEILPAPERRQEQLIACIGSDD